MPRASNGCMEREVGGHDEGASVQAVKQVGGDNPGATGRVVH